MASEGTATVEDKVLDLERYFKDEQTALNAVNTFIQTYGVPNKVKDGNTENTLLHCAAKRNFKNVAEILLNHGMNALAKNKEGKIALEIAIDNERDDTSSVIARNMKPEELRALFGQSSADSPEIKKLFSLDSALINAKCNFTETLLAVLDSLRIEEEDGSEVYDTKLLEEVKNGQLPNTSDDYDDDKKGKLPDKSDDDGDADKKGTLPKKSDDENDDDKDKKRTLQNTPDDDNDDEHKKGKLRNISDDVVNQNNVFFNSQDHTVFHILAEKGLKEAINHPILKLMINYKWNEWARKRLVTNFVLYLLSLFSLTFSVAVAATSADVKEYDTRLQHARAVFEIVAYGFMIKAIVNEIFQVLRHKLVYCKQLLNWLELISAVLLLLVLPVRYINVRAHWYIFAVGYFLWVIKIFKYAVVFSETGAYAESLRTIFWRNIIPFSLLFCIVNLAFGGTFLLVLKGDGDLNIHDETSSMWGIWYVGLRTMIEAQAIVEYTGSEGYRPMGTIVMLMFMAMTIVVLLNILIAQLTETYHIIQSDDRKSVLVNRAWIIARLERNALPCQFQCILEYLQKRLPVFLSVYLQGKETRTYKRYLSSKGLKSIQEDSTPMERISSALAQVQNKLVKTDLKVQTVKIKLRRIEEKIDQLKCT